MPVQKILPALRTGFVVYSRPSLAFSSKVPHSSVLSRAAATKTWTTLLRFHAHVALQNREWPSQASATTHSCVINTAWIAFLVAVLNASERLRYSAKDS